MADSVFQRSGVLSTRAAHRVPSPGRVVRTAGRRDRRAPDRVGEQRRVGTTTLPGPHPVGGAAVASTVERRGQLVGAEVVGPLVRTIGIRLVRRALIVGRRVLFRSGKARPAHGLCRIVEVPSPCDGVVHTSSRAASAEQARLRRGVAQREIAPVGEDDGGVGARCGGDLGGEATLRDLSANPPAPGFYRRRGSRGPCGSIPADRRPVTDLAQLPLDVEDLEPRRVTTRPPVPARVAQQQRRQWRHPIVDVGRSRRGRRGRLRAHRAHARPPRR